MPKVPRVNRVVPGKSWFLTWNNYESEKLETFIKKVEDSCDKYVGQEEVGESGTPHIQMKILARKKIRPVEFFGIKEIHWEKSRTWAGHEYCAKDETRAPDGKRWSRGVPLPLLTPSIYGWQSVAWDLVKADEIDGRPNGRTIFWFWSKNGNVGKTDMAKWLVDVHGAIVVAGKAADMKYMIAEMDDKPIICVLDIPRVVGDHFSYSGVEEIKNGLFASCKFKGKMVRFNSPHFICFSNQEPDFDKLSVDRWKCFNIDTMIEEYKN